MDEQDLCRGCKQKSRCQDVYRQLGHSTGPSVVVGTVIAFLVPMVVFAVSLAGFEKVLSGVVGGKGARTAIGFALALCVTGVCIVVMRVTNKRLSKTKL